MRFIESLGDFRYGFFLILATFEMYSGTFYLTPYTLHLTPYTLHL